jgi:HK97 family phage portal protein
MIFSRSSPQLRNEDITSLQSLAEWFGLNIDTLDVHGTNSLKEITVYTCIKILSETISKLPLKAYQEQDGIKKANNHQLYNLLKLRPNPYMSSSDFWKCVESQRNIHGNSYVWIDKVKTGKKAGTILGLYPLDSSKVKIYIDNVGLLKSSNKVWYVFTDNQNNQYKIESVDLLHFKGLTTDGIAGISPTETLRTSIENAKSSTEFLNNSYKNGMQTKGLIQYVGELNSDAENRFLEKFEQMSNGLKNANKVSLLPIGYQFTPIALSMVDSQFLENANLTIRQITAAYGIKLHQVNDLQKSSYASTSEANREFYTDTLLAILNMYEQELTYKLFTTKELEENYYFKFNPDVILRADIKSRYDAYRVGIQAGFITPNEARELEEKEPMSGGDKLFLNGTMIPIEMAGKQYEKGGSK